jgi:hypothetical protein
MNNNFSIDFTWLSREYGSVIERATLAELTITADGNIATELEDFYAKTVRKAVRASAYEAALWFASNWWRLLWEPERSTLSWRMSHKIGAAGGGYLWPDLSFSSDGETVHIQAKAIPQLKNQTVRYLNSFDVLIPINSFQRGLETFIEAVIDRLTSFVDKPDIASIWKEVREEDRDSSLRSRRKIEAIMGFDPDEAPDTMIQELERAAANYGKSAIEEVAASSVEKALQDITTLWEDTLRHTTQLRIDSFENLRNRILQEVQPSQLPWQRAEIAAKILREYWSLPSGPITTTALCERLSVSDDIILRADGPTAPMQAGFRNGEADYVKVFLSKPLPVSRRFALSRLIGDHLITSGNERLLPLTGMKTVRQKFQKAFAQELLCPYNELKEFLGDSPWNDEILDDAADHFDVSPLVIKTIQVNKNQMDRAYLMDLDK